MNFFELKSKELVNLDQVIRVLIPRNEYGEKSHRLVLVNGSIISLNELEWDQLRPVLLSYTFYYGQHYKERIEGKK